MSSCLIELVSSDCFYFAEFSKLFHFVYFVILTLASPVKKKKPVGVFSDIVLNYKTTQRKITCYDDRVFRMLLHVYINFDPGVSLLRNDPISSFLCVYHADV